MTVAEKMKQLLHENGLLPGEAEAILKMAKADPRFGDLEWDSHYPNPVEAVAWMYTKQIAVVWIDANKPKHVARMFLVDTKPGE
jgi:hypothetical protein